jgi:hypothetical protein
MLKVIRIGDLVNGLCVTCNDNEAELAVYSNTTAICCECHSENAL